MSTEQKITDLLYWIKDLGVFPVRPCRHDRFLNPYTNKIVYYHPHRANQLRHLLWIPNADGVKTYLPQLKVEDVPDLKLASLGSWVGAGPGESEAILSLFQSLRSSLPA